MLWRQHVKGEVIGSVVTADLHSGDQASGDQCTSSCQPPTEQKSWTAEMATCSPSWNAASACRTLRSSQTTPTAGSASPWRVTTLTTRGSSSTSSSSAFRGSYVDDFGAWPMFHHDPQLTGDALASTVGRVGTAPAGAAAGGAVCAVPDSRPERVLRGGQPRRCLCLRQCGLLWFAGRPRARASPVVGIAAAKNGGGYWLVNAAGEVFTFGDASFYGPTANLDAKAPIAGMALTPDDRGYWLVAQNGQVYSFGDAKFYGPKVQLHLPAPIAAMAATRDGRGYWLVARNGAMLTFGDAVAHSSAREVRSQWVVGIAADPATTGYWLVSAGGRVFAFDAPTYGSIAGYGIADAMAGIEALPGGSGYRLVDTGGELFCYGLATDLGTASTARPALPVVGIAAP